MIIIRKVFYALIIAVMMTSCMTYQGIYDIRLQNVERPENAKEKYGESKLVQFEEQGQTRYSYEDDMIKIVWFQPFKSFMFALKNKTDHSIKIIWDDAAYVDHTGESLRITHTGVKYISRDMNQVPTVVVKNSHIYDEIIPTNNVYLKDDGWQILPLFPTVSNTNRGIDVGTQQYLGKELRVLLPIKIEETIYEYIFIFKIEDDIIRKE